MTPRRPHRRTPPRKLDEAVEGLLIVLAACGYDRREIDHAMRRALARTPFRKTTRSRIDAEFVADAPHVLTLWFQDPALLQSNGRPRPLPLSGTTLSVESLVYRLARPTMPKRWCSICGVSVALRPSKAAGSLRIDSCCSKTPWAARSTLSKGHSATYERAAATLRAVTPRRGLKRDSRAIRSRNGSIAASIDWSANGATITSPPWIGGWRRCRIRKSPNRKQSESVSDRISMNCLTDGMAKPNNTRQGGHGRRLL